MEVDIDAFVSLLLVLWAYKISYEALKRQSDDVAANTYLP